MGDIRGCISHCELYTTTLKSQIKSGTLGGTKRLPWRCRQTSQKQNGDLPCGRWDGAVTVVDKLHSGFSIPSSALSQPAPFRNALPPPVGEHYSKPPGFITGTLEENIPFLYITRLPQPETSWETLAATRAGVVSLLREGPAVGVTGVQLVCSSKREVFTCSQLYQNLQDESIWPVTA